MTLPPSPGASGFAATAAVPASVDAHLEAILAVVGPLPELDLTLLDAHGCVLAEDVVADSPLPNFDNAQMDGYAVRAADLAAATEATPVLLPVVGDIAAGSRGTFSVQPGLCVRIMTGAPMPSGADAVVPVEWTDGGLVNVAIHRGTEAGSYVRRAGEDAPAGATVLAAGTYLQAAQLGLIAAVGRPRVRARPKPRVVIVSTGSELVELGDPLLPGQIYDSNGYALAAAAREAGAIAFRVGPVGDDPKLLIATIEDQLIRADIVVTTGGVSVGAHDVVREVIGRLGDVAFAKVAMQPGQPQAFGTIGEDKVPFFGLPGNPVSALVSFEVFVRPAIRRMLGSEPIQRPRVRARLTQALISPAGRRQFVRVRLAVEEGEYVATPVGGAGSHLIASMAHANALAVIPEEITELPVGTPVPVMVLERRHG
ncbi:molybdopterin molybdotransferase MoeA [Acidothermaceae bacterium B102]|nr:molybdopterin molybdotransferase MoeA [Acidothermaceae bacterium B102]